MDDGDGDAFELDDLDALLDAEPVEAEEFEDNAPPSRPTKVLTDYSKWDKLGKAIDEDEDEEEPESYNDEQQKTWDRMVKASGLQEEMKEELGASRRAGGASAHRPTRAQVSTTTTPSRRGSRTSGASSTRRASPSARGPRPGFRRATPRCFSLSRRIRARP